MCCHNSSSKRRSMELSDPTSARLLSRTISPLKAKSSSTTEVPLPKRHSVYSTNMLRQSLIQNLKPGLRSTLYPATRAISTTAVKMGEGDTGAPKSGGSAQGYISHTYLAYSYIDWPSMNQANDGVGAIVMHFRSARKRVRIITYARRRWKSCRH